jgi:hypothetical protein
MSKFPRLVVTGTHSSGKNYTSRILYELGFRNFLQEPLNPLSPPGVWMPKEVHSLTQGDTFRLPPPSDDSQKAQLRRPHAFTSFALLQYLGEDC